MINRARISKGAQVGRRIIHVAHLSLAWILLTTVAGCGSRGPEIDTASENSSVRNRISSVTHIDDIFTLEREVTLTDSIFIAHYTYLDIDADGDYLLTDIIGKQVILFDRNGYHKKTLSTEPCDPGFPWHPSLARFKPNGNIIVNSSQWGYELSNDGDCIGELSDEFGYAVAIGFGNNEEIYGFYVHGEQDRGYHIKEMNNRGKAIRRFGFDDTYFWYISRYSPAPDIVVDKDGFIYHAKIFNSKIDKYDKKGNLITQIGKQPKYYREVQVNDSEFAEGNNSRSAAIKYNNKFSLTRSLWLLNDETIIIEYTNEYNRKKKVHELTGLTFMDLEGNDLVGTDILTHINFITAKNGLAYSFFDSTNIGKGLAGGPPSLKIYRYLPPAQ